MRCRYQQEINVCPAEVLADKLTDLYCPHHERVVKAKEASGITIQPSLTFGRQQAEQYDYFELAGLLGSL